MGSSEPCASGLTRMSVGAESTATADYSMGLHDGLASAAGDRHY